MYLVRLDDASEYMDIEKWKIVEGILDKYQIKPLVGIIPDNKDAVLLKYSKDMKFWEKALTWEEKGWTIALHGYQHILKASIQKGINPINKYTEFCGLPYELQKAKIKKGYDILIEKGLNPKVFFAPAHTFDKETIRALHNETPIRVISDTIALNSYYQDGIYYIPQQMGNLRKIPCFKIITGCYHPNTMTQKDFFEMERFFSQNRKNIVEFNDIILKKRKSSVFDKISRFSYFSYRNIRKILNKKR